MSEELRKRVGEKRKPFSLRDVMQDMNTSLFLYLYKHISLSTSIQRHGGAGAYPNCHRMRGGIQPGQFASLSQD